MKKLIMSMAVIVVFAFYAFFASNKTQGNAGTAEPSQPADNSSQPSPSPVGKYIGTYKDGAYTGTVADAYYGNVQVRATVKNGKLSNVVFLQYPNDRSTSERINSQAMPVLKSEAVKAQSANVDIVSGATQTSQAFQESLGAALSLAAN